MSKTDYLISRFYNRTSIRVEIGDVVRNIKKGQTGKVTHIGHNGVLVRRTRTHNEAVWPYSDVELRFKRSGH